MATFLALQEEVKALGGYGDSDTDRIKTFINQAQRDVTSRGYRFEFLEDTFSISTVADTQTVALPSGMKWHGRLRPGETGLIYPEYLDWNTYEFRFPRVADADTPTGMPWAYSIFDSKYFFYPIPDAVYDYVVQGWRTLPDLSADGDLSLIPDEHEGVLVSGALMYAAARDKDAAMVQYWQDQYEGQIRELRKKSVFRQQETPPRVAMPAHYYDTYG